MLFRNHPFGFIGSTCVHDSASARAFSGSPILSQHFRPSSSRLGCKLECKRVECSSLAEVCSAEHLVASQAVFLGLLPRLFATRSCPRFRLISWTHCSIGETFFCRGSRALCQRPCPPSLSEADKHQLCRPLWGLLCRRSPNRC